MSTFWDLPESWVDDHVESFPAPVCRGPCAIDSARPAAPRLRRRPLSAFTLRLDDASALPAPLAAFAERARRVDDGECLPLLLPFVGAQAVDFAFVRASRRSRRVAGRYVRTALHREWPVVARPAGRKGPWVLVCSVFGCSLHDDLWGCRTPWSEGAAPKVPVDQLVPGSEDYRVVVEDDGTVWDCMLSQTNIGSNNNKFYVIQLLRHTSTGRLAVWTRWGRIGEKGQSNLLCCTSLASAKDAFRKKFRDKTVNDWESRSDFVSKPGKYTLIQLCYESSKPSSGPVSSARSSLDPAVQEIVRLIFDVKMIERVMASMEVDVRKAPLGALTAAQIAQGNRILQQLDDAIKASAPRQRLVGLSSMFYTLIPHDFGRRPPSVIETADQIRVKVQLLDALSEAVIASDIMKKAESSGENVLDVQYRMLECDIEPLGHFSRDWDAIEHYVRNTHPDNTPAIKNIFRVARHGEPERARALKSLGNRMLLWHGSRLSNFAGIISQGLRIAPPEAPVTGYRFGKGIYFADLCYVSAGYCHAEADSDFLMLLADVALGTPAELAVDQYMEKPLPGTSSSKALGVTVPDPTQSQTLDDGVVVPCGRPIFSGKSDVSCTENEWIVYNAAQVELKYLVHLHKK
eukprot:m51a1_g2363 hypothetical protein (631) ;mRNA; r:636109-638754